MDEQKLQSTPDSSRAPSTPEGEGTAVDGPRGPTDSGAEYGTTQPDSDSVESLYQQSLLHFQNGEWQEASAGFEQVLQLRPDHEKARAFLEETRLKAALEEGKPEPRRFRFRGRTRVLLFILLTANVILLLLLGARWAYARWIEPQRMVQEAQTRWTRQVEAAFKYLADRDYATAEQAFLALLAEDPNNAQLQQGLQETQKKMALATSYAQAEAAIAAQNWSEAEQVLKGIVAQDPQYAGAESRLAYVQKQQSAGTAFEKAEAAYGQGDWQQAAVDYEELRTYNPDYEKAMVAAHLFESYLQQGMGLVHSTQGNSEAVREAKALYEKALTLQPQEPRVVLEINLADRYLEGQTQLANGNLIVAQQALEWVCQQQPDYADGNAARLLRMTQAELPSTEETATGSPSSESGSTASTPILRELERLYFTATQHGDAAFSARRYAEAEEAYLVATVAAVYSGSESTKWMFVSYVKLGTVYAKRGNNGAAESALKTAIAIMGQSTSSLFSASYQQYAAQGDAYARLGSHARAFAQYNRAIQELNKNCKCGLEKWSVVP